MKNDMLDGLIALKLVAERRNFSAAAVELGISASAVSQTIKHLEQRVGIALLKRTTRSTNLTEAGEIFLSKAAPAIDNILSAMDDVACYTEKPSGMLRINMPKLTYPCYIRNILKDFQEQYPDITIELYFEDAIIDVVDDNFDAGIRTADIIEKDMVAVKLYGPIRFVIAAAPSYLDRYGRPDKPEDLLSHNCLCPRFGKTIYDRWEITIGHKSTHVRVRGNLIMNDFLILTEAAIDGCGLIYTTEDAIRSYVEEGKLETVLNDYGSYSPGFYLYYPSRGQVQPKLRAFIDYIHEYNVSHPPHI